ncbi:MAG: twin-arginine translocase TatA/TatE family subunit [Bacteroidota bacterium]
MQITLLWMPGGWELLIIALFIVIFFGAKKIPEIARGMGKGIREFKDATKEIKDEISDAPTDSKKK